MVKQMIDTRLNNSLCEAAGCLAKATTKIHIKVGDLGMMHLLLCKECVTKFEDSDNVCHLEKRYESQKVRARAEKAKPSH